MLNLLPVVLNTPSAENFVSTIGAWGAGALALVLIWSLVKEGIAYGKGSGTGSLWGIIGKALTLVLMLGIVFLAITYNNSLKGAAENFGNKLVDMTNTVLSEVETGLSGK